MYSGDYRLSLDDRSRMRIPTKLRNKLGTEDLVLTAGSDGCAFLMNETDLSNMLAPIMQDAKISDHKKQDLLRKFNANVYEITEDKQMRIVLPPKLKAYMHVKKGLVFIGMTTRIEIWAEEIYNEKFSGSVDEINSVIDELGI